MWAVLTSKLAGPLATAAAVALAIALSVCWIAKTSAQHQLIQAQNTVNQLKGTLEFQNLWVQNLGKESAAAEAKAKALLAASRAAHAGDDVKVAALLAAPALNDPAKACEAADRSILQFFDPQPEGAT